MKTYITVADVDAALGMDWTSADKKDRAVLMANVWMTNQNLPEKKPEPPEYKQAAIEIAREAAAGNIYGRTETGVMSKAVNAKGVSSAKSFSASHKVTSAGENMALALLKPWINQMGGVFFLKRI